MENTFDNTTENLRNTKRALNKDFSDSAREVKSVATGELKNFVSDVEDVVKRVADVSDADIARVRTKIQAALTSAKDSLTNGATNAKQYAKDAAGSTDEYVRASPWQAVGVAALVGLSIGFLVSRRS
ncbi:MAG: DUF883 domain-containing protein [Candidatus Obscuribacterales bacterium]|nr:DUF883 domain-containing protein [Steroidobacteraceae bacterium]